MGLVQAALVIAVFAILSGFGAIELGQYAQAKIPYQIVQRVVRAANTVNNAASSYIVQNSSCTQNGVDSCGFGTNALDPTWLPNYTGIGSGVNTSIGAFITPDGSHISVYATGQTTYNMAIVPGAMIASKPAYVQALVNALPAATVSGNTITVNEATPSMQNLLASNKPDWGSLSSGGNQSTGGGGLYTNGGSVNTGGGNVSAGSISSGPISSGSINTNGQPISSGSLSTGGISSGPIDTNGNAISQVSGISVPTGSGWQWIGNYLSNGYVFAPHLCLKPGSGSYPTVTVRSC